MKKSSKIMLMVFGIGAAVLLSVAGVCTAKYFVQQKQAKEAAAELKRKQDVVAGYKDIAYGNKSVEGTNLIGMDAEQIKAALKSARKVYKDRVAEVIVDDDTHTYTMKKLGEKIYYECSDGSTYQSGEEDKIADAMISLDKDKEMIEQYNIIKGKQEAFPYSVTIQCKVNKKKLNKVMKKLTDKYVIPAQNSHIKKDGTITSTKDGQTLDVKAIKKDLKKYLNSEDTENYSNSYSTSVVKPTWHKKDLKKVKSVISEFSTTFVSYTSRGHNIKVGTSRINGTCLLPGESVSFDEVIHDKSDGQAFQAAGSYLHGKVVQTDGGGICQISTTAYNALLRAGITPEKRYPHSMPVHYVPLGLDAAISAGVKDLKVKNTLDVPIVIKGMTKGNTLTFQIISYKNALGDYEYKTHTTQLSSLKAKAYLDIYKNGKLQKSQLLHTDTYISGS